MELKISPQAFTGVYKFNSDSNSGAIFPYLMRKEATNNDFKYVEKGTDDIELLKKGIWGHCTISADDRYDNEIEAKLKALGIKFKRVSFEEVLNPDNILKRIKLSDWDKRNGKSLVYLDVEKVDELFMKDKDMYIGKNGKKGIGTRYMDFIEYLKTGSEIDASSVNLREEDGTLKLSFLDGRHRYSVLRDMGIKKIPFSLDSEAKFLAIKHGLI